jgi:hypothetical protein
VHAGVERREEGGALREVEAAVVGGVDGEGGDGGHLLAGDMQTTGGMVVAGGHVRITRVEPLPGIARVDAAEESFGERVEHGGVGRVEEETADGFPEIDDAPVRSAVAREVGARHVAGHQRDAAIVWGDGGMVQSAPAARSEDAPARGGRRGESQGGEE